MSDEVRTLLLSPHHDDEVLFASYLCLNYRPHVIVCTTPKVQERYGVYAGEREEETRAAMKLYECEWQQFAYYDTEDDLRRSLQRSLEYHCDTTGHNYEMVFAPAYEDLGHEQHNSVALAARDVFGEKVVNYLTYAKGGRSRSDFQIEPDDPSYIGLKLEALSYYKSQLRVPNCRPWFYGLLDMREWYAS